MRAERVAVAVERAVSAAEPGGLAVPVRPDGLLRCGWLGCRLGWRSVFVDGRENGDRSSETFD